MSEVSRVQDGWSSHGHWIGEGEPTSPQPSLVARCGGPGMCQVCKSEKAALVSRVQEPERIGGVGRCGDKALQIAPQWGAQVFCRLPAGHPGWHRGDDDSEWTNTAGPPDYATAYASLHEVVRAFLAGERNAKYLRRMHAEIEADLTGGDRRG